MRKIYTLLLATGLLVGAPWAITQAIFSDTQSVDANSFSTGTVDLATSPTTELITYSNMAPADSTTSAMTVSNPGSLELRYAISSTAANVDTKGLKDQLVLTVKTVDVTTPVASPCNDFDGIAVLYTGDMDSSAGKLVGDSLTGGHAGDRTLAAAASEILCFRATLPSSTGNEFQDAASTTTFTFAAEQVANNA